MTKKTKTKYAYLCEKNQKEVREMNEELAYSIHLGSDKNKTAKAKEIAKNNPSGETSFSNNGIQNAKQLSKVNKHNLRDYDNKKDEIYVVYGTDNLYTDVQNLYIQEFEESRLEYNKKQTRANRKIQDYFKHISESTLWDLACEFIIELGDLEFWNDKDMNYRMKMIDVYKEQVSDLTRIVPDFKVANAVIHLDETSPHMHIVGLPISDNNKRGMKKQVAKSKIFTKESLKRIQDEMRACCIKSYNKHYEKTALLKQKKKGRNQDISVSDMNGYREMKKQTEKKEQKLVDANNKTKKIDNASNDINEMLTNLKPTKLNKNNMIISNEDVQKIKKFTEDIKDTTKSVRDVNDLNMAIKDFEHVAVKVSEENRSLRYQLELKDDEIDNLKGELSTKDRIIGKPRDEKDKLKAEVGKFKSFWRRLMKHFQEKIGFDKDEHYKYVSDDLYKNGIFDNNDNQIANDITRKVKTIEEIGKKTTNTRKNDFKL